MEVLRKLRENQKEKRLGERRVEEGRVVRVGPRLDAVYQRMAGEADRYEADRAWTKRTRADVVEWILQMAPFNQTDGCWLRGTAPVGPMDEVRALLFGIYADELGGGDPDLNHPNIYTELLRSVGVDLPDLSRPSRSPALAAGEQRVPGAEVEGGFFQVVLVGIEGQGGVSARSAPRRRACSGALPRVNSSRLACRK